MITKDIAGAAVVYPAGETRSRFLWGSTFLQRPAAVGLQTVSEVVRTKPLFFTLCLL